MTHNQIWGGAFMILAGISSLLANVVGYSHTWPIYPLAIGMLLICLRRADDSPRRRLARQFGGAWMLLTGVVHSIVLFTSYALIAPLYMIGGGLILLAFQYLRHREQEVR
jgi:hypothetical protein